MQLSVCADEGLIEFGKKLVSSSALEGAIGAVVNYEQLMLHKSKLKLQLV